MTSVDDFLRRLFTRSEYYALAQAGILSPDERLELIEGQIFHKSPPSPRHAACVHRLNRLLLEQAEGRYTVGVVSPVVLDDPSELHPDLSLLLERDDFYSGSHPTPRDVRLLIEAADTTIAFDRTRKIPLYARSGIPEVWLVDLTQNTLEAYRDPLESAHRDVRHLQAGDRISPQAFPEVVLDLGALCVDTPMPDKPGDGANVPDVRERWLEKAKAFADEIRTSRGGTALDVDEIRREDRRELEGRTFPDP